MIEFSNGHRFDFGCASGAMAFDGRGWWYDKPALWAGKLRPEDFTSITKSLSFDPIEGNYLWWCPWRCVWPVEDGMVNAVAFTNPGYRYWIKNIYPHINPNYKIMPSIAPHNRYEAEVMTCEFNDCRNIVGLQVNVGCPNVKREHSIDHICDVVFAVGRLSRHPVTVKLSWHDDYVGICRRLQELRTPPAAPRVGYPVVEAVELINTVLFSTVFPDQRSPLACYDLVGGVSGTKIKPYAREALDKVIKAGITIPIITGGGNDRLEEVLYREALGAKGWTFGTLFMWRAWEPNQIIARYRKMREYSWS